MTTIKVIFENEEYNIMSFNGTLEEAKQFYLGKYFNFQKVVKVVQFYID
jgi:hypothetical protein